MKCPNCGNELSPEEVFCGQCGAPNMPPAKPTERVNIPPSRQGLLSGGYNTVLSPPPNDQPAVGPPGPQQPGGFYQASTEAISAMSNNGQNYPTAYPPQGFAGTPYPGAEQYGPPVQPFQTGNYTGTLYPPTQPYLTGQGYGVPPGLTPPPSKQRSNVALIIVCICVALAIISVGTFGAVYLLHNNSAGPTQTTTNTNASPTSVATPTSAPSPSPTLSPTPSPSPTPSITPTPMPDPGFTWCDTTCTSNGFSVEYPSTWLQQTTSDSIGTQFANSSQPDEFAAFKTPGITTMNAGQLVIADLNHNFSSQPGYMTPTPTTSSNATIGGENWTYQIAYYQFNGQTERIEVYATLYQGKAYIIELQAPDAQFDAVNTQYFESMLGRFQFQQPAA